MTLVDSATAIITVAQNNKRPQQLTLEEAGIYQQRGEDGLIYHFETDSGKCICGARKKGGGYCHKAPIQGRNRCQFHGGKSPRGVAAARFKHGRYSKDIPARLSERYISAASDEKLLELRDEIALIESRIGDLLTRTESGESGLVWNMLKTTYTNLRQAATKDDRVKFAEYLNDMGRLINKGQGDYAAWDDVMRMVSARRRLVETERKRMVDLKQMMTAEQAMTMLSFVVNTIRKHVKDQQILAAISQELSVFLSKNAGFASK